MNPATIPDPILQPAETLSTLDKLYHSGAWLCLLIVAAFYLLHIVDDHVAWFQKQNRKHVVSALLGGLGMLVVPALQGTTPNLMMDFSAIGTVLALFAPGLVTSSKAPQSGRVVLWLLPLIAAAGIAAAVMMSSGCSKVEATLHDAGTCAESDAAKDIQPTIQAALEATGSVANKILAALESGLGADLVDCVVTSVKNDMLAKQGAPADAKEAAKRSNVLKNADAWLNRKKRSSLLKLESPEWRGREPAIACVAGWIPEPDRNGHPVCPTAMSRNASAE